MLFDRAPMGGPRYIWWNFVSLRPERIEQAKEEWARGRFDTVPGDEEEFIPLPETQDKPRRQLAAFSTPEPLISSEGFLLHLTRRQLLWGVAVIAWLLCNAWPTRRITNQNDPLRRRSLADCWPRLLDHF